MRRSNPDALITLGWLQNVPGVLAKFLARYGGVLLLSERGVLSYESRIEHRTNPLLRSMVWAAPRLYPYSDGVVTVGSGVSAEPEYLGVPRSHLTTIFNPIDADRVRNLAAAPFELPAWPAPLGNEPLFISVGRLEQVKNHRHLLDGFAFARSASDAASS